MCIINSKICKKLHSFSISLLERLIFASDHIFSTPLYLTEVSLTNYEQQLLGSNVKHMLIITLGIICIINKEIYSGLKSL